MLCHYSAECLNVKQYNSLKYIVQRIAILWKVSEHYISSLELMDRPNRLFFFFSLQKHLEGEDDFVLASFFSSRALLDLELRGPSTSLTTMAWTLRGNQLSYWVRPLYWASFTLVNISNVGVPAANSSLTAFCRSLNQTTLSFWLE